MSDKKENPWSRKRVAQRTATKRQLGRGVSSGSRPKTLSEIAAAKRRNVSRISVGKLAAGVTVGSCVKLTWHYDVAYGPGTASFEGKVTRLDDWIRVVNDDNVVCRMPLRMVEVQLAGKG